NQIASRLEDTEEHHRSCRDSGIRAIKNSPCDDVTEDHDSCRCADACCIENFEPCSKQPVEKCIDIRREWRIEIVDVAIEQLAREQTPRQIQFAPGVNDRIRPAAP